MYRYIERQRIVKELNDRATHIVWYRGGSVGVSMYRYVLTFRGYDRALKALRKLRRRGAVLELVVLVVRVEHWNKVKDLLEQRSPTVVLILSSPRPRGGE